MRDKILGKVETAHSIMVEIFRSGDMGEVLSNEEYDLIENHIIGDLHSLAQSLRKPPSKEKRV